MDQFFAKDWGGAPFQLFGPAHIWALVIVLCINLSFIWVRRSKSEKLRRGIRYTLAGILLLVEVSWHAWNYAIGQWNIQTMLPLHLCSLFVWLEIYMLITKNYRIYEFAYLLGIAAALQALLTPDAGRFGYPHFRFFQVIMSHGTLITAAVYLTVVEGFRPTTQSMKRVLLGANIYLFFIFILNFIIGSNYLFIAHKPETASAMDLMPPWPWYILIVELLGVLFVLLFYAPFAIHDWRDKHAAIKEPA